MKLVAGFGINDAWYKVKPRNAPMCPFYKVWYNMVSRVYGESYRRTYSAYRDCTVTPEWSSFRVFREWMETQDWEDKHLDKDLLIPGNKLYAPHTCIFITQHLNNFLIDRTASGRSMRGVTVNKAGGYIAQCGGHYLGTFTDEQLAHAEYLRHKKAQAIQLADEQSCDKIKNAILGRYP